MKYLLTLFFIGFLMTVLANDELCCEDSMLLSKVPVCADQALKLSCFPNSVSTSATILYSASCDGEISLDLYNKAGIKVRELLKTNQAGGQNEFATDFSKLPKGLYFITLKSQATAKTIPVFVY